jgi:hypothetical protein
MLSYLFVHQLKFQKEKFPYLSISFEEYEPLISLFFLAASDEAIETTDAYTPETRLAHFIEELAYIGRAHNWDRRDNAGQEYDDLEGDKPSCYSGVKRRLFQSVQGHPLFKILTVDAIKEEMRELLREHFKKMIIDNPKLAHTWQEDWDTLCDTGEIKESLSALDVSKEEQDKFIDMLRNKYGDEQLTKDLENYIEGQFKRSDIYPNHAARFGGVVKLSDLFTEHLVPVKLTPEELREKRVERLSTFKSTYQEEKGAEEKVDKKSGPGGV